MSQLRLKAPVAWPRLPLVVLTLGLAASGCKPASVSEAEAKGDVAWLAKNASPEAVAALGRLADKNPQAETALESRASSDVGVYIAAWGATLRGATWGPALLRAGLADPAQAETAASAFTRKDPHLAPFVPDLEAALTREGAGSATIVIPAILASVGPPAHASIERRLAEPSTRGLMCRGISSPDASADAKQTLITVPAASRDDAACVDAVVHLAASDDGVLAWLASTAEPGLLSAAGKSDAIPCPRVKALWTEAFATRPAAGYLLLAVPLAHAVKRCAADLDPLLAATLTTHADAAPLVVGGVDPFGAETADLKQTCSALPLVLKSKTASRARDRASDALAHGCRQTK